MYKTVNTIFSVSCMEATGLSLLSADSHRSIRRTLLRNSQVSV